MTEYFTVAGRRTTEMPPETKIGPKGQLLQRIGSYIPGRGGTFTYREISPGATAGPVVVAPHTSPVTLSTFASGIVQKAQGALGSITPTQIAVGGGVVAGAIGAGVGGAALARRFGGKRKAKRKAKKSKAKRSRSSPKRSKSKGSKANARRNKRGGAVKGRYKGRKVLIAKNGTPYVIMANGKARFIKK